MKHQAVAGSRLNIDVEGSCFGIQQSLKLRGVVSLLTVTAADNEIVLGEEILLTGCQNFWYRLKKLEQKFETMLTYLKWSCETRGRESNDASCGQRLPNSCRLLDLVRIGQQLWIEIPSMEESLL